MRPKDPVSERDTPAPAPTTSRAATRSPGALDEHDAHPATLIRRLQDAPRSLTRGGIMQLQRTLGNRAVRQLLAGATLEARSERAAGAPAAGTGLPEALKNGVEHLSGIPLDNVQVHYNSDRPARFQALAYAQGSEIHVAPGQEQHLPHEAWHVVQQAQGRVIPTSQMKDGVPLNDDGDLEREADVMGARAAQMKAGRSLEGGVAEGPRAAGPAAASATMQRETGAEGAGAESAGAQAESPSEEVL